MSDVIAHGMLSMAYLGKTVDGELGSHRHQVLLVRFVAMTHVGDRVVCHGEAIEVGADGDEVATIALSVGDALGEENVVTKPTEVRNPRSRNQGRTRLPGLYGVRHQDVAAHLVGNGSTWPVAATDVTFTSRSRGSTTSNSRCANSL